MSDGWLPIETAPKDGTRMDIWEGASETRWVDVGFDGDGWVTRFGTAVEPTHWRPAPPPPVTP